MKKEKEFLNWIFKSNKNETFTLEEVKELLEKIKAFNAGAIDNYLSKYVDVSFEKWINQKRGQ